MDTANQAHDAAGAHVAKHSKKYMWLIVLLVVVVIVLAFWLYSMYLKNSGSDSFSNNLTNGSNNPLWWHGGQTAGDSQFAVSLHEDRDTLQGGSCAIGGGCTSCASGSEGMCSGASYPSGMASSTSEMIQMGPASAGCASAKGGWSYGATAELDAQVQAGNFAAATPGFDRTQSAIDSARVGAHGLNDQALHCMLGANSYN